jgi:hypothetical protein
VKVGERTAPVHVVTRKMADGQQFHDPNYGTFVGALEQIQMDAQQYRVEPSAKVSADILNMAFGVDGNNEFVASTSLRPIAMEVARAMKAHGLAGKITPRLVRVLLGKSGVPIRGCYQAGEIDVRQDVADPRGVLFHEITTRCGMPNRGDRAGQSSIRINQQWRICFAWPEGSPGPGDAEIVDDH